MSGFPQSSLLGPMLIPGGAQGQPGWVPGQPDLVLDNPGRVMELELDGG